jgi:hypothetical protein
MQIMLLSIQAKQILRLLSSKLPKYYPLIFEQQRYEFYTAPLLYLDCGTAAYRRVLCRGGQKNGSA